MYDACFAKSLKSMLRFTSEQYTGTLSRAHMSCRHSADRSFVEIPKTASALYTGSKINANTLDVSVHDGLPGIYSIAYE